MFSKRITYLGLFMFGLLLNACSESDSPDEIDIPETPVVEDTHQYVILRNDGSLFNIGNKTGQVSPGGEVPGIEFNVIFNAVTASANKVFIYEARFDPPTGVLHVLDKTSGQTESVVLEFPEEFGSNPGLVSLDWDQSNQNLVGIVRQEMDQPTPGLPLKVVRLDPETFSFQVYATLDLNSAGYENVFSSQLKDQKLYVSASMKADYIPSDLLEIDLTQETFKVLSQDQTSPGMLNLGSEPGSGTLYGFEPQLNSGTMAAVRPLVYDIGSQQATELSGIPDFSVVNFAHKMFYDGENRELIDLVAKDGFSVYRYNLSDQQHELIPIQNPQDLSSLAAIIDVLRL